MGTGNRVPLAGVPYHAVNTYLAKLIQAGYKVAIVEQTSDDAAKGLMSREVMRGASPQPLFIGKRRVCQMFAIMQLILLLG